MTDNKKGRPAGLPFLWLADSAGSPIWLAAVGLQRLALPLPWGAAGPAAERAGETGGLGVAQALGDAVQVQARIAEQAFGQALLDLLVELLEGVTFAAGPRSMTKARASCGSTLTSNSSQVPCLSASVRAGQRVRANSWKRLKVAKASPKVRLASMVKPSSPCEDRWRARSVEAQCLTTSIGSACTSTSARGNSARIACSTCSQR
jgi:hypothetical protein